MNTAEYESRILGYLKILRAICWLAAAIDWLVNTLTFRSVKFHERYLEHLTEQWVNFKTAAYESGEHSLALQLAIVKVQRKFPELVRKIEPGSGGR